MKIAIFCVNFNSYKCLRDYLVSLDNAAAFSKANTILDVYVSDNSTNEEEINSTEFRNIKVFVNKLDNLGYLGGAFTSMNSLDLTVRDSYDYIIISNVDVTVNEDFFKQLSSIRNDTKLAWIAPAIYNVHLNKIASSEWLHRPSVRRIRLYSFLYAHPFCYYCYWAVSRLKIRASHNHICTEMNIYAGYGSFMIFTKSFISLYDKWNYKPFLFGEEIFFAEIALANKMEVKYFPSLQVNDIGKVSTGLIGSKGKLRMQKESMDYLYNEFFYR